ncbi:PREDICTED: nucleoplasmin-3 [Chrysochloris asiatica]|uniref:Nucleoplasmin-3 n=1 Tax=Chrysochloris asiatica TaxID=185453 RepID=A0A9B0T118_CHRAS|nr:PREDICTED: nucleoplasmin-3 [Chrysochloris asiatica]
MAAGTAAALAFLSRESRSRMRGIGALRVPAPVTMDSFFFGCELSGGTRSFTFKVEEEDDAEHVLALTMLCLTEGAKDECNVIEVVARNHDHQEIAVPVANLRLSCQPMLSLDDFQLQPPVTFRLRSGSGPVRITGRHQIVTISNDISEEEEESEEEDSEEEEAELCPVLPAKKQRGRP